MSRMKPEVIGRVPMELVVYRDADGVVGIGAMYGRDGGIVLQPCDQSAESLADGAGHVCSTVGMSIFQCRFPNMRGTSFTAKCPDGKPIRGVMLERAIFEEVATAHSGVVRTFLDRASKNPEKQ